MKLPGLDTLGAAGDPRGWLSFSWAEAVVTDRRRGATLAAMALGFGLFVGTALGPGSEGSQATGAQVIQTAPPAEEPVVADSGSSGGGGSGGGSSSIRDGGSGSSGGGLQTASTAPITTPPITPAPVTQAPVAPVEEEAPADEDPADQTPAEDPEEDDSDQQTLDGTVVHANSAASSYGIVINGGLLYAVHAKQLPDPGAKLSVPVRMLANGTFAEDSTPDKAGSAKQSSFDGTVTFVDANATEPAYTVSRLGVSVLIRVRPPGDGTVPELPKLGSFVTASVSIEKPGTEQLPAPPVTPEPDPTASCAADPTTSGLGPMKPKAVLWQRSVEVDDQPSTYSDFAGIVTAICPESRQIAVSADDIRSSARDVVFTVPDAIDVSELELGESVAATANIAEDGSLELAGLASDERIKGADDSDLLQGDLGG